MDTILYDQDAYIIQTSRVVLIESLLYFTVWTVDNEKTGAYEVGIWLSM